ncbi:hypothetical protein I79_000832 [Cricetulus griseus]|uniref:Uncharacterized protein n=1 Tax=Cricetulus griseus TaxID=10029 RepID=G3GT58_CRIGR|nr:hypothetical protein I79_000832 [Cricetulus griseus]
MAGTKQPKPEMLMRKKFLSGNGQLFSLISKLRWQRSFLKIVCVFAHMQYTLGGHEHVVNGNQAVGELLRVAHSTPPPFKRTVPLLSQFGF